MTDQRLLMKAQKTLRDYRPASLGKSVTFTDRAGHAALQAVSALLRLMPLETASTLMGRLWRWIAPLNARHGRADANLAAAIPHLSPAERREILLGMWDNLGRVAAETLRLDDVIGEPDRVALDVGRIEDLRGVMEHGAIFASLHQGNYELAGWGIRLAGFPTAAVYRPLNNPLAEEMLRNLRAPIYDAGLFPKEHMAPLVLRSLVRKGTAVGMLADLPDKTGILAPFLGRDCWMTTLPALLARRLKVPLVAGRVVRTGGVRFRIEARPIEVPFTADVESDVRAATLALNHQFEAWILDQPSQWMWGTNKWVRTAPATA